MLSKEQHEERAKWLINMNITQYCINDNNEIDVHQDVYLYNKKITHFPFKFGTINGYFDCGSNQLTSLKNSPRTVRGTVSLQNNLLESLEDGPSDVRGSYFCYSNNLKNLIGAPQHVDGFACGYNPLETFEGMPTSINTNLVLNNLSIKTCIDNIDIINRIDVGGDVLAFGMYEYLPLNVQQQFCDRDKKLTMPFEVFKIFLLDEKLHQELHIPTTKRRNHKI